MDEGERNDSSANQNHRKIPQLYTAGNYNNWMCCAWILPAVAPIIGADAGPKGDENKKWTKAKRASRGGIGDGSKKGRGRAYVARATLHQSGRQGSCRDVPLFVRLNGTAVYGQGNCGSTRSSFGFSHSPFLLYFCLTAICG